MKKIKIFKKKYPAPEEMVHGSHSVNKTKKIQEGTNTFLEQRGSTPYDVYLDKQHNTHLTGGEGQDYDSHIENIHSVLSNKQDFNALLPKERESVKQYTRDSSTLNSTLITNYQKNTTTDDTKSIDNIHVGDLDSATKKFTLPKMSLFHGASFDPTRLGKPTSDGHHIVHMPAFVSTSYNHSLSADQFANPDFEQIASPEYKLNSRNFKHMLEIKVPEGHPGVHVGRNSSNPVENEVLLPRGMTLKIKSQPTIYSRNTLGSTGLKVWEAHPVPDNENPETWQPPK